MPELEYQRYRIDLGVKWPGVEVVLDEVGIRDFLVVSGNITDMTGDLYEDAARVGNIIPILAGALVEWTITRGGNPVPADATGLDMIPLRLVTSIAVHWLMAMGGWRPKAPDQETPETPGMDESSLPMEVTAPT